MLIEALTWLGLHWDEGPDVGGPHGPYRQSERGPIYREHCDMLIERGHAYRCFCTAERLETVRQRQRAASETLGYDGHCRTLGVDEVRARLAAGEAHVVRLKVPKDGTTVVRDRLRGDVSFENTQVDDQVLLKSDGMPTYHLANVVDDHLMGISHVMRAEEWITSTPKHVLLYQGFGWQPPEFIHMPLLRNQDKSKISKRKNPVSLNFYRQAGFLPEAMLNYLGMMGWTMPDAREKFSVDEMIADFTFDRISLGGPVFDVQKLTWLNGLYLRELEPKDLVARLREQVLSDEALLRVAPLVRERIEKLEDWVDYTAFFFSGEVAYDAEAREAMVPKKRDAMETAGVLTSVLEVVDGVPAIDPMPFEEMLRGLADRLGWKAKEVFMALRIAVTGRKATPPLFETMAVLGKERCRRRLRQAIALLHTMGPAAGDASPPTSHG